MMVVAVVVVVVAAAVAISDSTDIKAAWPSPRGK